MVPADVKKRQLSLFFFFLFVGSLFLSFILACINQRRRAVGCCDHDARPKRGVINRTRFAQSSHHGHSAKFAPRHRRSYQETNAP
uniref:Putative secreted protein n=1 Tax=Amblyomma triste TaxID=251400 RepID=A0A023G170_AMBTT